MSLTHLRDTTAKPTKSESFVQAACGRVVRSHQLTPARAVPSCPNCAVSARLSLRLAAGSSR